MVERVAEPAEGAGAARGVGEPVPREEPRGEDEGTDADGRRRPQQRAEAHPHRVTGSDPGLPPPAPDPARARWTVLSSWWQEWRGRCLGVRGGHLKEQQDQNEDNSMRLTCSKCYNQISKIILEDILNRSPKAMIFKKLRTVRLYERNNVKGEGFYSGSRASKASQSTDASNIPTKK